jgi:hypothetical protein
MESFSIKLGQFDCLVLLTQEQLDHYGSINDGGCGSPYFKLITTKELFEKLKTDKKYSEHWAAIAPMLCINENSIIFF